MPNKEHAQGLLWHSLTNISTSCTNFWQKVGKWPILKLARKVFFEMLFSTSLIMMLINLCHTTNVRSTESTDDNNTKA